MNSLIRRYLGRIAALAIFGAALFVGGEYVSYSHPSGLLASTPIVAPVPAGPEGVKTSAPGFTAVAKAMTPAVVNITSRAVRARDSRVPGHRNPEEFFGFPFGPEGPSRHQGPFGPQGPMEPREHRGGGMGSGVIVSPDGYIVTNNHVVDGAGELTVTLPDKREFKGKVVGTDPKTDLAVVKIDAHNLPYANWGDSSKLQVGEYVLAIGN
ncbi:MAG: trypsin-like peptidase domain-containing protein, partial [Nitrospirota bacterium]